MKKRWFVFFIYLIFFFILLIGTTEIYALEKINQKVVFLPICNLTNNEEYAYLAAHIYEIFRMNLQNQSTIELIHDESIPDFYSLLSYSTIETDELFEKIYTLFNAETCITGEYFILDEKLHINLKIIDILSLRIKRILIYTLPADSKMNKALEEVSKKISIIVAKELPPLGRDALIRKQLSIRLLEKLDIEERTLDSLLQKKTRISGCTIFRD